MKYTFYIIGLLTLLLSCRSENNNELKENPNTEKIIVSEVYDRELDPFAKGLEELHLFQNKYEKKWDIKPILFPYSNSRNFKVFKLDCSGECFKAEFIKRESSGIEISKNDFKALIELLNNPKSYDNTTAACYDPKFGLIVYDKEKVPTEFLSICLDCNSFRTYPGQIDVNYTQDHLQGFSKEARTTLREMFLNWGIDYYGYSFFWDDEKEFEEYLKNKKNP